VFVLLIVPAFIALSQKRFPQLLLSWFVGGVLILFSLGISYIFDLPTGYTIVFILSLLGIGGALVTSGGFVSIP